MLVMRVMDSMFVFCYARHVNNDTLHQPLRPGVDVMFNRWVQVSLASDRECRTVRHTGSHLTRCSQRRR